jgi:hypothetical protein
MVPMTDSEWTTLLEGVGLMPKQRELVASWRWAWCEECQAVRPVARWQWWPPSPADPQSRIGSSVTRAAARLVAGATVGEPDPTLLSRSVWGKR